MELLNYTDAHKAFRERLRSFISEEVTPNVDQWEKDGIEPKSIWRKMGQNGFLCTDVPQAYNGMGGDFLYSVIVTEELSHTFHTGLASVLHSDIVVPYISAFGSEAVKRKYLPGCVSGDIITAVAMTEPDAGSDLASIATTAEEEGDEVIINGSKTFISNGINGELFVIAARDPAIENPYQAISLYLIEDGTPGFERGRHLEKMGWWSQDTAELFFSKCRIPKANRLGEKGMGFLMLMQKLQQERLMCALGALVAAERMVAWITDYCKQTKVRGKPLSKSQVTQFALVEMTTDIKLDAHLRKSWLQSTWSRKISSWKHPWPNTGPLKWLTGSQTEVLTCAETTARLEKCPMVRAWRDIRVTRIFAGTNEVMRGIAAKFMGL